MKIYVYPKPIFPTIKSTKPVAAMEGIESNSSPENADYLIYPFWLYSRAMKQWRQYVPKLREGCRLLPYYRGNERKHIFFDMNDNSNSYGLKSHFFRTSIVIHNVDRRAHSVPYTQRPISYRLFRPAEEPKYHLSFCGNINAHKRKKWCRSIQARLDGLFLLKGHDKYYGHVPPHAKSELEDKYIKMIQRSRFVLCPRGGGPSSRRVYETMAAGRVPVVISSHWIPPFNHVIDWSDLIVHGKNAERTMDNLETVSDEQAAEMGQRCQLVWYDYIRDVTWWKSIELLLLEDMP